MRIHETMAENKIRFAQRLNEMSEELANLAKEVDKNRKQVLLWHRKDHVEFY
jgi:Rho GTPase-activating protein RGD1